MLSNNYPQGKRGMKLPIMVGRADFNKYINPYLSKGSRGPKLKISRYRIFNYVLYVLHTGIQWKQLKTHRNELHWSNVYRWHNKWSKDNTYKNLFETSVMFLRDNGKLDLSSIHGDGSNTIAKKGARILAILDTNIRKD